MLAAMKPGWSCITSSVAVMSRPASSRWRSGRTVKTLIKVTTGAPVAITVLGTVSSSSGTGGIIRGSNPGWPSADGQQLEPLIRLTGLHLPQRHARPAVDDTGQRLRRALRPHGAG